MLAASDAAYCYTCSVWSVCLSVCVEHIGESCEHGGTDRSAVLRADSRCVIDES